MHVQIMNLYKIHEFWHKSHHISTSFSKKKNSFNFKKKKKKKQLNQNKARMIS